MKKKMKNDKRKNVTVAEFTDIMKKEGVDMFNKGLLDEMSVFFLIDGQITATMIATDTSDTFFGHQDQQSIVIREMANKMPNITICLMSEVTMYATKVGDNGIIDKDNDEKTDGFLIHIENKDSHYSKTYTCDSNRVFIDQHETFGDTKDLSVGRFQNFFKADFVYEQHLIRKQTSNGLICNVNGQDFLTKTMDLALEVFKSTEIEFSFVCYQKRRDPKVNIDMLSYDTATDDLDAYIRDKKNTRVCWAKTYTVKDNKTGEINDTLCVYVYTSTDVTLNAFIKKSDGSIDILMPQHVMPLDEFLNYITE